MGSHVSASEITNQDEPHLPVRQPVSDSSGGGLSQTPNSQRPWSLAGARGPVWRLVGRASRLPPPPRPSPSSRFHQSSPAGRKEQTDKNSGDATAEQKAGWTGPGQKGSASSLVRPHGSKRKNLLTASAANMKWVQERIHLCMWPLISINSPVAFYLLMSLTERLA